jgi:hypothetical protein
MVTILQVQRGLVKFVDNYVATSYSGLEKAVILGGATILSAGLPKILKNYTSTGIVSSLEIYNPDTGMVDIDSLYNAFMPHIGNEKIPIKLARLGSMDLGTIKLGKDEIDVLIKYIKES